MKIKMNGHRIYPSKYIKYLGIYVDETLNGSYHCKILSKKLKRANGMLCKARHYIPIHELKSLYYAIFSSHLVYGCQIWGQVDNTFNAKVFKLQNRALRIITFSNFRANSLPLFHHLNILRLREQIFLQNCLFVYDTLKKTSPLCFHQYFNHTKNIHNLHTRCSNLGCLYAERSQSIRFGINSITSQCISNWNDITKKFNTDPLSFTRSKLKNNIKLHFTQSYCN